MKRNWLMTVAFGSASVFALAGSAYAQQGEYIVSSQVVSDTVVGGDATASTGGCASGDCGGSVLSGGELSGGSMGGGQRADFGTPDLFYNYYTQGNNAANAQMYVAPVPVPPNMGHTFYTYQPFYPHEMLYHHKDRYHNYYDNGRGLNRTRVHYYSPPVRQAASNFYWNALRIPR